MPRVEYSSDAVEWLEKADTAQREQVRNKIEEVRESDFFEHFLNGLTNSPYYKLRAGDYRLVADWRKSGESEDILYIRRIGHRDGFYD